MASQATLKRSLCKLNHSQCPLLVLSAQEVLVRLDKGMGGSLMTIKLDDVRVCRYMLMKTR